MSFTAGLFVSLGAVAGAVCALAQSAPPAQLSARELFYNTAAGQAATPAAPAPRPAAQAKPRPKTVAKATPAPKPAPAAPGPASAPVGGVQVIPVSATEPAPSSPPARALGLKYTILKSVDNQSIEVAPDTVFHAGDRVRFSVEPNGPGYLYIVTQGSSGNWELVFPSGENPSNRVEGWRAYTMPPKSRLVFDEQTGTEKIFIVLSRAEVPDLERLIYSLKNGAQPASTPEAPPRPQPKTLVAGLRIGDDTIGRLRDAYARDLIIEKVDEDTPGDRKEKAVYVVNPTGSSESRVVADIELVHK